MADSKRFQAKNGLDNNSKTIINVFDPVNNTDAVNLQYANAAYQSKDADLTAIATLPDDGTGLLKKTATNTWQLFTGTTLADYGITDAVSSSLLGAANGVATLGPDGTLNSSQIPAALLGSVSYKGVWNASINTPAIPIASSTNKGWYYKISVAGTTNIDGISDWQIGDWVISNGTTWDKIDNTDLVSSVNGLTGAVTLTTTNIAEGTQLYFTEARVRNTPLTGYSIGSTYTLSATDTVLQAFNKLSFGVVSAHDAITRTKKYHGMFYNAVTNEYDTTLSYTLATRTLTISPIGASYKIFVDGTQYTFTSPQNIQHAATEGGWFIYYNTSGVLTASQTQWNLLSDIPVAYVYYDATTPEFLLLDERHHHTSDKEWHNSQHFAYGTYVKNSTDFVLGNYTIGTSSNAAVTWSLGSGTVVDEDIHTLVSAVADGGPYQTWHKSGASGAWRRIQRSVPYHFNSGTNWAQYNAFTGGSWQLVDMANNQFTNYYIFAVPALDTSKQIIIVPSQNVYTSESDAESEGLASIDLTGFPSQEFVGVWKLVLRTNTAGGASGRAQIRYVTKLAGSRASVTSGGFSPTVHNSLSGRSDAEAHPASSITNIPAGNIAALTLQGAINELDSEKGGLSLNNSWTGSNTFTQALTALQFVKSGGTSSQFLKADGSVDSSVYLTSNQTITISGDASGSGTTAITLALSDTGVTDALLTNYTVGTNTALTAADTVLQAFQKVQGQLNSKQPSGSYQPLDADLTSIAGLAGTSGLLRKTAANTWSLDTTSYEPAISAGTTSQYYRGDKTWQALDTAAVTESTNLYFTNARVLGTVLTGLNTSLTGAVAASDTILAALGKLENRVSGFSASGVSSFNTRTGAVTLAGSDVTTALGFTPVNESNAELSDKLVRLNKGGAASSGNGAGIEVEENGSVTGYIKTSTARDSWVFSAPSSSGYIALRPSSGNYGGSLDAWGTTANRTWTLPDATGTIALTSNLTSYAPLSGATFTGNLTSPNVIAGDGSASPSFILNGAASNNKLLYYRTGGVNRWTAGINTSSADPYTLNALDDAGTYIDTPFTIDRAAGGNIKMVRPTYVSNRMAIGHANISAGTLLYLGGGATIPGVSGTSQYGLIMNAVPSTEATAYYAAYFEPRSATAAYTIPTLRGIHIADATKGVGSTITTQTGLHIASQTQGTTNYAIYTNLGQVRFGDTVDIAGVTNIKGGSSLGLTFRSNKISTEEYNGVDTVSINYTGYLGGTTQFRNFNVYDGKNGLVLNITGSSKAATFSGAINAVSALLDSGSNSITQLKFQSSYDGTQSQTASFKFSDAGANSLIISTDYVGDGNNIQLTPGGSTGLTLTRAGSIANATFSGNINAKGVSTSWGSGTSDGGAFNATMGTSSGATWLLTGTSGGVRRCGIQALDSNGSMMLYAGSGYVNIDTSANITTAGKTTTTQVITTGNGTSGGIVLRNPSGTRYRLSINSSGYLQLDVV